MVAKPRPLVNMSCFEMLHNAHLYVELLSHKLDIVEQSLQLFSLNMDAMTELAVTTPPCKYECVAIARYSNVKP